MSSDAPEANRLESLLLNLIFAAVSLTLLALIGIATRTGQASAGWWTRPAMMPGIALSILVLSNLFTLIRALRDLRANPPDETERAQARAQVLGWLRPVEFLAYFAAYLWAIHAIGYGPATLLFVGGLMLRVGLRSAGWIVAGLAFVCAVLLVFRVGLGVWMPAPPLYDLLPDGVRSLAIRWF